MFIYEPSFNKQQAETGLKWHQPVMQTSSFIRNVWYKVKYTAESTLAVIVYVQKCVLGEIHQGVWLPSTVQTHESTSSN